MRKIMFWVMTMAAGIIVDSASADIDTATGINNNGIDDVGIDINNTDIAPIPVTVTKKGRTVQVDGFLLEWDAGAARRWAGTSWRWDAVVTAQGVAGYFTNAGADSSWAFTITAKSTKKSFTMAIPENPSGKHFAFDKGTFESTGALTVEWLVPWGFFEDEDGDDGDADVYVMAIAAASGAGDLPPMDLSVASPRAPRAPADRGTQAAMIAITAVLTVALVLHRRRKIREFGRRQEKS